MQVPDIVRDGLNDTMPAYGEENNRGDSITDAWDCKLKLLKILPLLHLIPMQGCEEALTQYIQENLLIVATIAITFVVAEVYTTLASLASEPRPSTSMRAYIVA